MRAALSLTPRRRPAALLLSLGLLSALVGGVMGWWGPAPRDAATAVARTPVVTDSVRVLISLDAPFALTADDGPQLAAIADAQAALLADLAPADFVLLRRYTGLPVLSGLATPAGLATLERHPRVLAVTRDAPGRGHLGEVRVALGADVVHDTLAITGQGVTVAVLDTGVDSDHPDLSSAIVAQHCFTDGDCPPGDTSESSSAEDEHGHGTNVAGIVTADGIVSAPGVAPGADLVAVRVLDSNNAGWVSDWIAALDWIWLNQASLGVDVVNMSLGTFALYAGNCDGVQPQLAQALARLRNSGVLIFASGGNEGSATHLTAPACNSGVVAVGATYDSALGREPDGGTYQSWFGGSWPACADDPTAAQTITCFTNSSAMLDLVAPGARVTAPALGGGTSFFVGSSQAAPAAAGTAALLLEANDALTATEIEQLLADTGPAVVDPKNDLVFPAVDALAAVQSLGTPPVTATIAGPAQALVGLGVTLTATVAPPSSTLPLTYRWSVAGQLDLVQSGSLTQTAVFTFTQPGPHVVDLRVGNLGGQITASHAITLSANALSALSVAGPTTASIHVTHTFTASVQPLTVARPITYTWSPDDRPPMTQTAGLATTAAFSWALTGTHRITVTAVNESGLVSATHAITLTVIPPLSVTLDAPLTATIGQPVTVTARVTPLGATPPLTYTWAASGLPPLTTTGGTTVAAVFVWPDAGPKSVLVTVTGSGVTVNAARVVQLIGHRVYLPVIRGP